MILALFGAATFGHFVSGNELLLKCREEVTFCYGFVEGVFDTADEAQRLLPTRTFCPRPEVKAGQTVDIVVKYLEAHPENRDFPGTILVGDALVEAFPCPVTR